MWNNGTLVGDIVGQLVTRNGKIDFVLKNESTFEVGVVAGPRLLGRMVGEDVFLLFFPSLLTSFRSTSTQLTILFFRRMKFFCDWDDLR